MSTEPAMGPRSGISPASDQLGIIPRVRPGLERVELFCRRPSSAALHWLSGVLASAPARARVVSTDVAGARQVADALGWKQAQPLAGVERPRRQAWSEATLRVVLADGWRDPLARWALRRDQHPVILACGTPPALPFPWRLALQAPGELAAAIPWLQPLAARPVELLLRPRLVSGNQLTMLRELDALEGELARAARTLGEHGYEVSSPPGGTPSPAGLTLHLRPRRGFRGWFQEDEGVRLAGVGAPILRIPPSQGRAEM